ncbi:MAG: alpha-ketoacid dehydrogenase subunit beta, partial [Deltaproteobacteria bacterium]|nr:alpha-ketoacid dehydrogenase subunit beta [Deltaproteobacteria bacterium]
MRELTFVEAINEALHEEMARDERVFVIGEDIRIGYGKGGAFGATNGLFSRFGPDRVIDTPISESAIAGLSVGALIKRKFMVQRPYSDHVAQSVHTRAPHEFRLALQYSPRL